MTVALLRGLIEFFISKNLPVLVDPKGNDFSKYSGVTLLTPNKSEASIATGIDINSKESLLRALRKLQQITNSEYSLITLGEIH